MNQEALRIGHLTVQDLARIELVETDLPPGLTVVAGNNESGKSTLLSAIAALVHGKGELPPMPVREGAERASIKAQLVRPDGSSGPTVTLTQTARGTYRFELRTPDGDIIARPMDQLAELRGAAGPDPVAMAWQDDDDRIREAILGAIGVDTSELDANEKRLRSEREATGRDVRRLRGAIDTHGPHIEDAPEREVTVRELADRLRAAEESKRAAERAGDAVGRAIEGNNEARRRVAKLEADLVRARQQVAEAVDAERQAIEEFNRFEAAVIDPAPVRRDLDSVERVNRDVRHNESLRKLEGEHEAAQATYRSLTDQIERMATRRAEALRAAGLDVPGLDLSTGVPRLDGRPWAVASKGRRLKASIGVVAATKANLRVAWTQEGDCLDEANLAEVARLCREHDLQLLIERTGERDHGALILRDGTLAQAPATEARS